jgi:hypothetical protein
MTWLRKDIGKIVDDYGFAKAESILSEWNLTSISLKRWGLRRGQSPRAAEAPGRKKRAKRPANSTHFRSWGP